MKKYYKFLIVAILVIVALTAFVACDDNKNTVKTSLDTPQNLGANGSTISWDAVEGASSYEIIVDEGEAKTTSEVYYRLDISAIGTYQIKVRAVGTNEKGTTIYSEYAQYSFVKSKKLSKPTVSVDKDTKVATWNAVENASSYLVVTKNSSGEIIHNDYQEALSFSFDNDSYTNVGKYTIQVKAIPDSTKTEYANSDAGVNYYVISKTLAAPSIASVNSTSITWTSVTGSVSYRLMVYKVGATGDELVCDTQTTSNSYAFSSMNLDDYGLYYCLIQAIGDGEVYITSNISERAENFDLDNVETINAASVTLLQDPTTKKWEVTFSTENADLLSSFTLTLKTTKADNSSSMPTLQETIWVKDGTYEYADNSGEYDSKRTYYTRKELGSKDGYFYEKNTEDYNKNYEYYTYDGDKFTKVTTSYLENSVEYYVKRTANFGTGYYAKAKGEARYTEVATGTIINTAKDYYVEDSGNYTLVKSRYIQVGKKTALDPADTTTKYFSYNTGDSTYNFEGYYDDLAGGDVEYYVYKSFTQFETGTTYYVATYSDFSKAEFDADPTKYYVISKATFTKTIDDIFFTEDGGEYTYKKSDIAYYGKNYTISITADATNSTTITGDDVIVDGEYTSYRKPILIDKTVEYENSKIKGYFVSGTEEENIAAYQAFANAHHGWYAVDSIGALQYMAYENDMNYVLMQDLDAEGYYWNTIRTFTGELDGNNHKIENIVYKVIYHDGPDRYLAGLIGELSDGTVRDLYILNASNEDEVYAEVGGIVAYALGSTPNSITIENCYVKGSFQNAIGIGGIVAEARNATITNCQSDVTIKNASVSGGIVAMMSNSTITNAIALGEIKVEDGYVAVGDFKTLDNKEYANSTEIFKLENDVYTKLGDFDERDTDAFKQADGTYYSTYYVKGVVQNIYSSVGGVVGACEYSVISNSVAAVKITVDDEELELAAGGFVGKADSTTIDNSYAGNKYSNDTANRMEMVVSADDSSQAGGFVGAIQGSTSVITNCYSTIRVSAANFFGGFVGVSSEATFNRCYVTGGISKQTGTDKGAFVASQAASTFNNCYVYDKYNDQEVDSHAEEKTLEQILTLCNEAQANSYATIDGYLEPCVIGPIYAESYEDSIKASAMLAISTYYINADGTVVNMVEDNGDLVEKITIGDTKTKGSALVIFQEKTGTHRRVVIYVTVS